MIFFSLTVLNMVKIMDEKELKGEIEGGQP